MAAGNNPRSRRSAADSPLKDMRPVLIVDDNEVDVGLAPLFFKRV
jgi:hypothetical protein